MSPPIAGWPVHRWGDGPRRIVFAHASLAQGGSWAPVARRLGEGVSALAPDLPGHGKAPDWDPSQGDFHALATRVMGEAAGRGPVDLVGHSLGATVLLRLALERPGIVRRLVLIEPVLFAAVTAGAPAPENAGFTAALREGDLERAARLFLNVWGEGPEWAQLNDRQREATIRRMPHVADCDAVLSRDTAGLLRPGRLEAFDRPVLLLHGERSPDLARRIVEALARRLPDARVEAVAGAGHMLPLTHPEVLAARLAG